MSPKDASLGDLISAAGPAGRQNAQEIMGTDKSWNCKIKFSPVLFFPTLWGYQWEELKKAIPQITPHSIKLWKSRITNPAHKYSQVASAVFSFPTKTSPQQTKTWNLPSPSQVVEIFFSEACQNLVSNIPWNIPWNIPFQIRFQHLEAEQLPWNDSRTGRNKWTFNP